MIFERSETTNDLVEALRGVNDEVSYATLANQVGVGVGRMKASLASARRILVNQKPEPIKFSAIKGHGLRRLDSRGVLREAKVDTRKLGQRAGRIIKHLRIAKHSELPPIEQVEATILRGKLSSARAALTNKKAERPLPP